MPAPDPVSVAAVEVPVVNDDRWTATVQADVEDPERRDDLVKARSVLWGSIGYAAKEDPVKVGGLVKELRSVWRDLAEIDADAKQEEDPFNEFLNAGSDDGVVTRFPSPADRAHA